METKIQFQKNATILSSIGKQLGFLERVVVNPKSKVVTDIVVRTRSQSDHEDKVVPIELVAETNQGQVVLRDVADELKSFPPLEEKHLIDVDANEGVDQATGSPRGVEGNPEYDPTTASTQDEKFVTRVEQNIPRGTVAMREGAAVITADGKNVGNVVGVIANAPVDQISHLLIAKGLITNGKKLIPIKWVMTMGEDEVYLRVKRDSVEKLDTAPLAV
jgi:uncharacterized protein YrrD